jgi:glycosyltransferase involved in cell wall biosynthesis
MIAEKYYIIARQRAQNKVTQMTNLFHKISRRFSRRPKVSVCVPLYNTEPARLRLCMESILSQTFKDFELLILNDSPDNKELDAIVRSYKDKRIFYWKNKKNLGISPSRNKLLDWSRGEYIAVHDHDDVSMPERFAKQVEFLDNNPNYGAVGSDFIRNDDWDKVYRACNYDNVGLKKQMLVIGSLFHTVSMLRKSVLDKHGVRYEQEYSPAEDLRIFMRLAECTMLKILPEVLLSYHWGENNTSKILTVRYTEVCHELWFQYRNKFAFSALNQNMAILREKLDRIESKLDKILRAR